MALTKVVDLIKSAQILLLDETGNRWPETEVLKWYNAALKEIALHRPDVCTVTREHVCTAGVRQALGPNDIRLIEITHNVDGRVINPTTKDVLDVMARNWMSDTTEHNQVVQYVYDERAPKQFYLYPRPALGLRIEIIVSKVPDAAVITDFETDETTLAIDDVYENAILDYMLFRAFSKDSKGAGTNKATFHRQLFDNAIGIKNQADAATSPNAKLRNQ